MPADAGLHGELVVRERNRLAFERVQQRLARRGAGAADVARQWPAHHVASDLVRMSADLTGWPYERRRTAPETLFADHVRQAPVTLCPSTTDPAVTRGWPKSTAAAADKPYVGGARS
ncbi:hypothetical protein AB0950_18370 [Streptomyces sp. NPDC007189]|uniref:hypothetical protein n=1 Tax=Streptomyces sp. NPDC007189 TaxID=3154315 RepID=UPI003454178D